MVGRGGFTVSSGVGVGFGIAPSGRVPDSGELAFSNWVILRVWSWLTTVVNVSELGFSWLTNVVMVDQTVIRRPLYSYSRDDTFRIEPWREARPARVG